MKCRYRFPINWRMRPDVNVPIEARGWLFEFKTTNGVVTHLDVTVSLPNEGDWPVVIDNPKDGVRLHINPKTPHLRKIQGELRALQGLLGIFGLESIDFDGPEVEWIPESHSERQKLMLHSFSFKRHRLEEKEFPSVSFDLIARSVLAADKASDIEVPLNFSRRGMIDVIGRSYIEAIYDFYFIIEGEYGDGKFKKAAVLKEFMQSGALRLHVEKAITEPNLFLQEKGVAEKFLSSYAKMTVDQALSRMVDLRGYLHHQTNKRRGSWHPEDQQIYEVDALFFQAVAYRVIFELAERYLWDATILSQYEELARRYRRSHS